MKKYKTVLLDADNTLFDFNKAEKCAIKETFANFDIICNDELSSLYHEINDKYWKKLERKEVTKEQLDTYRFKDIFDLYGFNIDPLEFNNTYKNNLSKQSFLLANAEEIVKYLYNLGLKLIISSNGSSTIQHSRINNSTIKKYIYAVYTSQEAVHTKPSKEFFDMLFNKFNLDRETTILIGDSPTADIKGGVIYNIDTIFFSPNGETCSDATYTVKSLLDIKKIIY